MFLSWLYFVFGYSVFLNNKYQEKSFENKFQKNKNFMYGS